MVSSALLVLIYVSFISLGLPDAVLGSAWPLMSGDLSAPVWGAGLIQMTICFCTIISSLNSARLIRRFGTGKLTAFSVALTAAALLLFSLAKGYVWLLLMAIPLGLGAGAVDAALNNYVALHCKPWHMSWLHCSWGVGASVGPIILSSQLKAGMTWNRSYVIIGVMQCVLSAVLFATLSKWKKSEAEEEKPTKALTTREVLALPGAKQGMLTFLLYCTVEQMTGLWAVTYMVLARGVNEIQAASWGALYCMGLTAGRALSGFMTMKFTPRQMIGISKVVMLIGIALLFVPSTQVMVAALVIFGLGCAPMYPNIIQDTPRNYGKENSQAAIGVQMASAYVGTTFMPTIFGAVAGVVGYGILPAVLLVMTLLMCVMHRMQMQIVDGRKSDED